MKHMIGLFEAAAKLEVTPPTVKAWVRKGRLKCEQVRTYGGKITWEIDSGQRHRQAA